MKYTVRFDIFIESAPISLIGTFGRRKNCKLCETVKHKLWCKDKKKDRAHCK